MEFSKLENFIDFEIDIRKNPEFRYFYEQKNIKIDDASDYPINEKHNFANQKEENQIFSKKSSLANFTYENEKKNYSNKSSLSNFKHEYDLNKKSTFVDFNYDNQNISNKDNFEFKKENHHFPKKTSLADFNYEHIEHSKQPSLEDLKNNNLCNSKIPNLVEIRDDNQNIFKKSSLKDLENERQIISKKSSLAHFENNNQNIPKKSSLDSFENENQNTSKKSSLANFKDDFQNSFKSYGFDDIQNDNINVSNKPSLGNLEYEKQNISKKSSLANIKDDYQNNSKLSDFQNINHNISKNSSLANIENDQQNISKKTSFNNLNNDNHNNTKMSGLEDLENGNQKVLKKTKVKDFRNENQIIYQKSSLDNLKEENQIKNPSKIILNDIKNINMVNTNLNFYSHADEKLILKENIFNSQKDIQDFPNLNQISKDYLIEENKKSISIYNSIENKELIPIEDILTNKFNQKEIISQAKIFNSSKENSSILYESNDKYTFINEKDNDIHLCENNNRTISNSNSSIEGEFPNLFDKNKIEFYYFEGNSKGMIIRAILSYSKIKWENKKILITEWHHIKPLLEFKQLPVLNYEGKIYSQSFAIEIFLARKFELMGKTPEDEFLICSLLDIKNDLISKLIQIINPNNHIDSNFKNQQRNLEIYYNNTLPIYLKFFEKILKKNFCKNKQDNYVLESGFSLADIIFTIINHYIFKHQLRRNLLENLISIHAPDLNLLFHKIKNNQLDLFFKQFFNEEYVI